MRTAFLSLILLTFATMTFAQQTTDKKNSEYFVVLYTTGENWDTTKQVYEQPYFNEHSAHLSELRKTKKISIGGRYSDTGILILEAKDETEAQSLITKDPAIQHRLFKVKIFPIDLFYPGCVE
jgi:uncharacterized protein YciI